ncbi:hypothetical protein K7432_008685 [Basidiobolus ranarum]|uniref:Uncharacterized protein n=1 Tax=Basidiobolus ranarum TaxID=34480 RepID=A0ABR2VY78_9FUNG
MNSNHQLSHNLLDETLPAEAPPPYTRYPEHHEVALSRDIHSHAPFGDSSHYHSNSQPQRAPPNSNPLNGHAVLPTSPYNPGQSSNSQTLLFRPRVDTGNKYTIPIHDTNVAVTAPTAPISIQQYSSAWTVLPQLPSLGYHHSQPGGNVAPQSNPPPDFGFICGSCGNRGWRRVGKLCSHCPYGQQWSRAGIYPVGNPNTSTVSVGRQCYKCKGQGNTLPIQIPILSMLANSFTSTVCSACRGKGSL